MVLAIVHIESNSVQNLRLLQYVSHEVSIAACRQVGGGAAILCPVSCPKWPYGTSLFRSCARPQCGDRAETFGIRGKGAVFPALRRGTGPWRRQLMTRRSTYPNSSCNAWKISKVAPSNVRTPSTMARPLIVPTRGLSHSPPQGHASH